MKKTLLALATFAFFSSALSAQEAPLWLRRNDISPDGKQIVFNYKGNIYTVAAEGGSAKQITSHSTHDTDPMWTPDGKHIVFSSYRNKSKDIYKVPAEGGVPVRLTTHSGSDKQKIRSF